MKKKILKRDMKFKRMERTLGEKIREWDLLDNQTVKNFNRFFNDLLPFDDNLEVEIKEAYTDNGRILMVGGTRYPHLFGDNAPGLYVYEVYKGSLMVSRFGSLRTLSRDLNLIPNSISSMFKKNRCLIKDLLIVKRRA